MGELPRSPAPRLQSDRSSTSRTQPGLHAAGTCENRPMSGSTTLRGASTGCSATTRTHDVAGVTCA